VSAYGMYIGKQTVREYMDEKEAEIARLKAANARGQEYSQQLFDEIERLKASLAEAHQWDADHMAEKQVLFSVLAKKDALITELADWAIAYSSTRNVPNPELLKLIQRAREATR
jgi:hypothetical protein